MNFEEKTIQTEKIFNGQMISVQVDRVRLPNGKEGTRELVKHPGAVAIMPFTDDGRLIVVRQFRKPLEKEIYEIPAGKLELDEDPQQCAGRELEEETGYKADSLKFVMSFYTSPGFADELLHLYEARGLRQGIVNLDPEEFVEQHAITLQQGMDMIQSNEIHDVKTAFALYYWQNQLLSK